MPESDARSASWRPQFSWLRGSCKELLVAQALPVPGKGGYKSTPQPPWLVGCISPVSLGQAFCSGHLFPLSFPSQTCIPEQLSIWTESAGGGGSGEGCPAPSMSQMPMESWGGLERIINCH